MTSSGIAVDNAIASVENQSHSLPSISLYNIKCSFCHVSSFEKKRDNEGKVFRKKSSFNSAVQCSRCHSYACWDCIDMIWKKSQQDLRVMIIGVGCMVNWEWIRKTELFLLHFVMHVNSNNIHKTRYVFINYLLQKYKTTYKFKNRIGFIIYPSSLIMII